MLATHQDLVFLYAVFFFFLRTIKAVAKPAIKITPAIEPKNKGLLIAICKK